MNDTVIEYFNIQIQRKGFVRVLLKKNFRVSVGMIEDFLSNLSPGMIA